MTTYKSLGFFMPTTNASINKSELIADLTLQFDEISPDVVEEAVHFLLEQMVETLAHDGRIELRGFGSFCLHHRKARTARNPRTGDSVKVSAKAVPYFRPGKALREAVDYDD